MEPRLFMGAFCRGGGWVLLALLPGLLLLSGCEAGGDRGSAEPATEAPPAIATEKTTIAVTDADRLAGELSEEVTGETVSVVGQVVQQCPASGCWFIVESESGETFINLIPSGIRLSKDRVGQRARVSGKVVERGSELAVEAREVEFAPSGAGLPVGER